MKKLHHILIAAVVALGFSLQGGMASAATSPYDITGDLSTAGDYSVTFDNTFGKIVNATIEGDLPSNTMVVFTYDFGGDLLSGSIIAGLLNSGGETVFDTDSGTTAPGSNPLLFASAQFNGDNTATAVIKNLSSETAVISSLVFGVLAGSADTINVTYQVSAVPLPAALPLFGAGLGALAGFGIRRKRQERAA